MVHRYAIKAINPTQPIRQLAGMLVFLVLAGFAAAQNTNGPAVILKTTSNLLVSWTGIGTLQSSPTTGD